MFGLESMAPREGLLTPLSLKGDRGTPACDMGDSGNSGSVLMPKESRFLALTAFSILTDLRAFLRCSRQRRTPQRRAAKPTTEPTKDQKIVGEMPFCGTELAREVNCATIGAVADRLDAVRFEGML